MPTLSQHATNTKIVPNLNYSLISPGQLCDDNCIIILTKHNLLVKKNNQIVLKRKRSISDNKL